MSAIIIDQSDNLRMWWKKTDFKPNGRCKECGKNCNDFYCSDECKKLSEDRKTKNHLNTQRRFDLIWEKDPDHAIDRIKKLKGGKTYLKSKHVCLKCFKVATEFGFHNPIIYYRSLANRTYCKDCARKEVEQMVRDSYLRLHDLKVQEYNNRKNSGLCVKCRRKLTPGTTHVMCKYCLQDMQDRKVKRLDKIAEIKHVLSLKPNDHYLDDSYTDTIVTHVDTTRETREVYMFGRKLPTIDYYTSTSKGNLIVTPSKGANNVTNIYLSNGKVVKVINENYINVENLIK